MSIKIVILLRIISLIESLMAQVKTSKSIFSKRVFFIKCVFPDQGCTVLFSYEANLTPLKHVLLFISETAGR